VDSTGVKSAWASGIRPEPDVLVSDWADAHRILPQKSSAEPGPWRTARTPYLREIMDCMSTTSDVEEVVFMAASQVGKSEALLNVLGYIIDHAPGPALLVQPTVDLGKRFSRQRVEPLVDATPRLAGKVADGRSRDARSSMQSKEFMGGVLVITGANSAVGLRSMPARWLLLDEIDGYPVDVDGEGSPIDLAEARQRTFPRRKRFKASSPTIAGRSSIERAYEATDQRRYYVPCPHCGAMQPLEFARLTWTKLDLPPEQAVYVCRACEEPIQESAKTEMLERGEWRAEAPENDGKIRGYHLSALYSPLGWMSWGDIAAAFVAVHKNPLEFRVFTNTVLGETWRERGEAPEWKRLYERRESYGLGTVPRGGLVLTAGADVQKDRIVVEIVAWGRGKSSWSIDYGVIPGDTSLLPDPALDLDPSPWKQLDELLARVFPHEDGAEMPIRMLAVDSGYNTQTVYSWCRKYPMNRVIAVKGQASGGILIGSPSPVDINMRGKRPIYGYKVWPVCGAVAKSELYGWLRLETPNDDEPFPPGFCHFPEYDDDYFQQLTAEHLVSRKTKRGFVALEWELIPGRENHVLDCRVYARAAASLVGLDRWQEVDWAAHERALSGEAPPPAPPRPRGGWLSRRPR
jgi:phage terminase large subunit GpA-like protein